MREQGEEKHKSLGDAGLLNPRPEQVRDPLFREHLEFFDRHDLLQVRYELLRAHLIDQESIGAICKRYGVSRQTFYNLSEKLKRHGTAGLLPRKPGPKGASKVTAEVVEFVRDELEREPGVSGETVASRIEGKFAIPIHKRTIEKLLSNLRSKKNS